MGAINLADNEKRSIEAIDEGNLTKLIDEAIWQENPVPLYGLSLSSCGSDVAGKLSYFEAALRECRAAKSAKKREETGTRAKHAGNELAFAFRSLKRRMEIEEQESQLFYVEDHIYTPHSFTKNIEVRVSYRWRRTVEDTWAHGRITFHHQANPHPAYMQPRPKRKPSAAQQARDLQDELCRTWEHLKDMALYTLRDYFRDGGDGSKIPETFKARTDSYTGDLNNRCAEFWHEKT
ncbi:hypothetical protein [Allomesorhizobium camelthorni]|uniref:Uncharacterized protein n=1 Tax=Allomesorhizobium camelthorni TaxID=475069 RepID=A0A6G4W9Z5_9HYPH|nr:hypothetical protein [Mesorhizobium camelthorni]NGO51056.1 hypothetical protein [Mesorhizobium camelthorni]